MTNQGDNIWHTGPTELSQDACKKYSNSLTDQCKKMQEYFKIHKQIDTKHKDYNSTCNLLDVELIELLSTKLCPKYGWR
jgi:hypothetical protein